MRKDAIKVSRPDPETGEVVEEIVAPDHFRPKLPAVPKLRAPRVETWCPRWRGLNWLAVHALREQELAYWLAHRHTLTRAERRAIADGSTAVIRPIEQEWQAGEVFEVASNLTAEVLETTWLKRKTGGAFDVDLQYRTTFKVLDMRPFLLRRTPTADGPPQVDEHGYPVEASLAEQARARIDGAYTTQPALAVPDSAEEIDDKLRRRLHEEQSMKAALSQARLSTRQKKMRLEFRIAEARRKHWRSTEQRLERERKRFEKRNEAA